MKTKHRVWSAVLTAAIMAGCSLSPGTPESSRLSLVIPPAPQRDLRHELGVFTPPGTVDGFDCYAVNVMAGDIPPSISHNEPKDMAAVYRKDPCSTYPGISSVTVPASSGGVLELTVPTGPARVVQMVGVKSAIGCPADRPVLDYCEGEDGICELRFPGFYELGRAVVDIFSDTTVTIPNQYPGASAKDIRCPGGHTTELALLHASSHAYSGMFSYPGSITVPPPGTALAGPGYCAANNSVDPNLIFVFDGNVDWTGKKLQVKIQGFGGTGATPSPPSCPSQVPGIYGFEIRHVSSLSSWVSTGMTGTNGEIIYEATGTPEVLAPLFGTDRRVIIGLSVTTGIGKIISITAIKAAAVPN